MRMTRQTQAALAAAATPATETAAAVIAAPGCTLPAQLVSTLPRLQHHLHGVSPACRSHRWRKPAWERAASYWQAWAAAHFAEMPQP